MMDVERRVDACAGGPLLRSLEEHLRAQMDGISSAVNELASIEKMIQELMRKREDKMYEIEDMKAAAEITQNQIDECKRTSMERMKLVGKRHNISDASFSLFHVLPPELYVHIFKYLSPQDLCKSSMLTSKYFHEMSKADVIWSRVFKRTWGSIDEHTCNMCRHLSPEKKPIKTQELKKDSSPYSLVVVPSSATQERRKEVDGDELMVEDLVNGMEKLDVSWLSGFKHRAELENNWKTTRCSVSTLYGHSDWVTCLIVVEDVLISGSWDTTIKMWNLGTKECTTTLSGHTAGINAIDLRREVLVSASLDCTLRVWNINTKQCTAVLEGHTDQVSHVNFISPRNSDSSKATLVVSGSLDGTLRVWDTATNKCLHVLQGHTTGITSMTTCHQYAASGSVDGAVMVWDCLQGRCIFTLSGHTDRVTGLQFDFATSRLVSGSWDFSARVWDLKTGTCAHVLTGHVFRIRCLSLHENTLVTGSWDSDLKVWDLKTGTCVRTLSGHANYVWGCELQSGGQRALSSSWDKTVKVWDTHSGKLISTLDHVSEVLCLHVNSHRIVGASKEIRIWDYSASNAGKSDHQHT